jgi:hypothetical protein
LERKLNKYIKGIYLTTDEEDTRIQKQQGALLLKYDDYYTSSFIRSETVFLVEKEEPFPLSSSTFQQKRNLIRH